MDDKRWDVFISHASEDKDTVARPLAAALKKAGARVWLDEHELKLGDSLSEKIDHGLAASRFGVVVISPSFLAKQWPRRELAGLRALEESGQKVILPIWHDVDKAIIARTSPVLADLFATTTSNGIDGVAAAILDVIFAPDSGSPSSTRPTVSRRLIEILKREPTKNTLIDFLRSHSRFVSHLLHSQSPPVWNVLINGMQFDAIAIGNLGTTRVPTMACVIFLPLWGNPFVDAEIAQDGKTAALAPLLIETINQARRLATEYRANPSSTAFAGMGETIMKGMTEQERAELPEWDLPPLLQITIFAGRRRSVDATRTTAQIWRDYRERNPECQIRTYDSLIDSFREMDESQRSGFGLGSYDFENYSGPYCEA